MKKGSKHTEEAKNKNRIAHIGRFVGEKNNKWKGVRVGYGGLHDWIRDNFGKAIKCENNICPRRSKTYQWANISGKYKRNILDWKQLCASCHKKFDWKPKKICIRRHRIKGKNIWMDNRGHRVCKKCKAIRAKKDYEKDRQKVIDRVSKWRKNKKVRSTKTND